MKDAISSKLFVWVHELAAGTKAVLKPRKDLILLVAQVVRDWCIEGNIAWELWSWQEVRQCWASLAAVWCSICFERADDSKEEQWSVTHCGHYFHTECLEHALTAVPGRCCPLCRVRSRLLIFLLPIDRSLVFLTWTEVAIAHKPSKNLRILRRLQINEYSI